MSLPPPDGSSGQQPPGSSSVAPASPGNGRSGGWLAAIIAVAAVVFIGVALVAALGVAALVRYSTDSGANSRDEATPPTVIEALTVPTVVDASGGILVNLDGTVGGTPTGGAVRVDVYTDLMCPICNQFATTNDETLAAMRADGTIAVYYHPVSILDRYSSGTRYSTRAASALVTVAQYDSAHFEAFQTALFDNQPKENSVGLSESEIAEIAIGVGVPEDIAATFSDGNFEQWVTDATDAALVDGLAGTPWIRAEQTAELNFGIWSNTENLRFVLQYIHDNGLQAFLDAMAAA